jgi:predicted RNA-binding protein with PUA-like domain
VTAPRHWLAKTEPGTFSWDDLVRRGRDCWDGVRNFQARNHLAAMAPGDRVLVYHSGADRQIVGVALVVSAPYPDPTADDPRWVVVDLEPLRPLPRPVTLASVKADAALAETGLVRQSRLSVMPLDEAQFERVLELGGADEG